MLDDWREFDQKEPYGRWERVLLGDWREFYLATGGSLIGRSSMGDLREFDREFKGGLQVANLKMRSLY